MHEAPENSLQSKDKTMMKDDKNYEYKAMHATCKGASGARSSSHAMVPRVT